MNWIDCKHGRDTIVFKYASIYYCAKIGSQRVVIKIQAQENCRAIDIIIIFAFWLKLAPLLIFNPQEGIHKENDSKK